MPSPNLDRGSLHLTTREAISVFEPLLAFEATPMFLTDESGKILNLNAAAEELFGYSRVELLEQSVEIVLDTNAVQAFHSQREEILREAQPQAKETIFEFAARHKRGQTLPVDVRFGVVRTRDGVLLLTHFRDQRMQPGALEKIQREAARAEILSRVSARLNEQLDLPAVLARVCEETARALDVAAVNLALYDRNTGEFYLAETFGLPRDTFRQQFKPFAFSPPMRIVGKDRPPRIVLDVQAQPDLPNAELYAAFSVRTLVGVVMTREDELIGDLQILTLQRVRDFNPDELSLLQAIAAQAAQAITNARLFTLAQKELAERKSTEEKLANQLKRMNALRNIYVAINASTDLKFTLRLLIDELVNLLNVDAADILLLNPQSKVLEFGVGRGFRTTALQQARWRLGEGYAGRVAIDRRVTSFSLVDTRVGSVESVPQVVGEKFVAYHAAPLIAKGQVKGVLELFHRTPLTLPSESVELVELFANQAATAIDNNELFANLQRANWEMTQAYNATIETFARALDYRHHEAEGHTQRVAELTMRLGKLAGVSEHAQLDLRRGALLHDIGKIRVPDHILLKAGPLNDEEWELMRQHPVYAHELLSNISYLQPALDIPYNHHEHWDGSGYPRGLAGEAIPLAARVFSIVEVWDVMSSTRPYRKAMPEDQVREHIRSQSGKQFDPHIVKIFLQMMD